MPSAAIDYDSLHVFGSTAYYHVKKSKLHLREKKTMFVGITSKVKGYRLECPITKKIVCSRDITFDNSAILKRKDSQKDDKTNGTSQQVKFEKVKDDISGVEEMDSNSLSTEDEEEVLTQEPSPQ